MSWWNAKYKNKHDEYEITFASKTYEKAKAVERICQAVIDKKVKSREDVEAVIRCKNCVHRKEKVCCNPSAGMWVGVELKDNDFCSYGERREGE